MMSSKEVTRLSSGKNGGKIITDQDGVVESNGFAALILENGTEFGEGSEVERGDFPIGYSFDAGFYLVLPFKKVKINNGSILLYSR